MLDVCIPQLVCMEYSGVIFVNSSKLWEDYLNAVKFNET